MITIQEIAQQMQVSVATVSNALNGKGRMRADLRRQILQEAERQGYEINARNTERGTGVIAIAEDLSVSFCADIAAGLSEYAEECGVACPVYSMSICAKYGPRPDVRDLKRELRSLLARIADSGFTGITGILYIANTPRCFDGLFEGAFDPAVCRIVYVYCQSQDSAPCVNYNDRQGARMAASALIESGAKRIAMFSGLLNSIPMSNRLFGFQLALGEVGLSFDPSLIYIGDWTTESGYRLAKEMLARSQNGECPLPDAIFSQNDEMAAGILRALSENGVRVPDDIQLIGFDDKEIAGALCPTLTTVRPPLRGLGAEALRTMLLMQSGGKNAFEKNVFLPCELVRRGSTRNPAR